MRIYNKRWGDSRPWKNISSVSANAGLTSTSDSPWTEIGFAELRVEVLPEDAENLCL